MSISDMLTQSTRRCSISSFGRTERATPLCLHPNTMSSHRPIQPNLRRKNSTDSSSARSDPAVANADRREVLPSMASVTSLWQYGALRGYGSRSKFFPSLQKTSETHAQRMIEDGARRKTGCAPDSELDQRVERPARC